MRDQLKEATGNEDNIETVNVNVSDAELLAETVADTERNEDEDIYTATIESTVSDSGDNYNKSGDDDDDFDYSDYDDDDDDGVSTARRRGNKALTSCLVESSLPLHLPYSLQSYPLPLKSLFPQSVSVTR